MTEDDTFNILRRTPKREMRNILHEFSVDYLADRFTNPDYSGRDYQEVRNDLLKRHGWVPVEYNSYFVE